MGNVLGHQYHRAYATVFFANATIVAEGRRGGDRGLQGGQWRIERSNLARHAGSLASNFHPINVPFMRGTNVASTLIWHERTKPLANALDRGSTAVAAGGIFPLINTGRASQTADRNGWVFITSAYVFVFTAVVLRLFARRVLGVLR